MNIIIDRRYDKYMLLLERKFLKNFQQHKRYEALEDMKKLLAQFLEKKPDDGLRIRYLKNYIIWLNGLMFEKTYMKPGCKKRILFHKENFFKTVELKSTSKELIDLALVMVNSYLDSLETRCQMINPIVNNAIIYIDNHLSQDLSLERVAEILNISQSYLSSLFTETIKTSFSSFVNLRRIKRAKLLLETTDLSLIEIALECGFNSQSYFCYVFKKMEEVTPTVFKKQHTKTAI